MKRNLLLTLAVSCCLSVIACGFASAEQPCGQPWQTPLASIEGTITNIYYATPPGTQRQGLHLGVQTASGEYVAIHVFPKECVNKRPAKFLFRKGEQVKAVGSVFYTQKGRQRNFCAASVQSHALSLRDLRTGGIIAGMCQTPLDCQQICQKQCQGMRMPQLCLSNCQAMCRKTNAR